MTRKDMQKRLANMAHQNRSRISSNRSKIDHAHPCCKIWQGTDGQVRQGHFSPRFGYALGQYIDDEEAKAYTCPRGHTFLSKSPIVVAVDEDPEYNTGPICSYCYVDWFKANLNANEVTGDV